MNGITNNFESSLLVEREWSWAYDNVYIKPNIPPKKLTNALTYASGVQPNDVILLIDDTVFGGAKDGVLLTSEAIYCHELMGPKKRISLSDIEEIGMDKAKILINGNVFYDATVIGHITLLTITSRINSVLQAIKDPETKEDEFTESHEVEDISISDVVMKREFSDSRYDLNFIKNDVFFVHIQKFRNLTTATNVAGLLLFGGDGGNVPRPISKITDTFIHTIHKCIVEFRKIMVSGRNGQKLTNDLTTLDVICYVAIYLVRQLQQHDAPESVTLALAKTGVPGAVVIDSAQLIKQIYSVIGSYSNESEDDVWTIFCTRLYINNKEKRFIADHSDLYSQYVFDIDTQESNEQFIEFCTDFESRLVEFEEKVKRRSSDFVTDTLNIIYRR